MGLRNDLSVFRYLLQEGNLLRAPVWFALTRAGIRREMGIRVRGVPLHIRTATPDAQVATSCLRGEFADVIHAMPGGIANGLVIDAGGYIGTAAIAFAKAWPSARIVSIEPSGDNYRMLVKNVAAYPNIRPVRAALGAEPGKIVLRDRGTGNWGFTVTESPDDHAAVAIEEVDLITVDKIMADEDAQRIEVFKIDIEGAELGLLSTEPAWVARTGAICIELHERIASGCEAAFKRATIGRTNRQLDGEKVLSLAAP